jgi:hypothetical protein
MRSEAGAWHECDRALCGHVDQMGGAWLPFPLWCAPVILETGCLVANRSGC